MFECCVTHDVLSVARLCANQVYPVDRIVLFFGVGNDGLEKMIRSIRTF
jgi:hypothetical protein